MIGYSIPYYTYLSSRNANKVVEMIRERCSSIVIGNHDLYALRKTPINKSFFNYPKNWYDLDFAERKKISNGELFLYEDNELPSLLTSKNKEFLASLPEYIVKDFDDHKILFTHYAFPDCTGSSTHVVNNTDELKIHFKIMEKKVVCMVFPGMIILKDLSYLLILMQKITTLRK